MNIDYVIIAIYLAAILTIGIASGLGVKGVKDYAVAKRGYSTFFLTMTFLASSFGSGAVVGDVARVATDGIIFTVAISGFLVCCLIMAHFVAPYFDGRFAGMISAGDIMNYFYGRKAEQATALLGLITSSLYIGGQLTAMGHIIGIFLQMEYKMVIVGAAVVVMTYSAFGGMRSVAMADVFKFSIIVIMVPLMTITMVADAGGISAVFAAIPDEKFSVLTHHKFSEYALLFLVSFTPFLWMYPPIIQRFLMAKQPEQIAVMYRVQFAVRIMFMLMIVCIAFSGAAMFPGVPPKDLVAHIVNTVLPMGCKGMFIVCVLAASMSTSDSHMNAASVLLAHNLFKFKEEKKEMLMLRFGTILVGFFAIIVAVYDLEIVNLIMSAFSIWGAAVTIPLLAAVMKVRASSCAFWSCLASVVAAFVVINIVMDKPGLTAPAVAVFAGLIGFSFGNICWRYSNKAV